MFHRTSLVCLLFLGACTLATAGCGDPDGPGPGGGVEKTVFHALQAVTHGDGRFVAVGNVATYTEGLGAPDNEPFVVTSTDGAAWTRHDAGLPRLELTDVAFGNGLFVAVGGEKFTDNARSLILTSPDGESWTEVTSPTTKEFAHVTFGDGVFMALTWDGFAFLSNDGATFTAGGELNDDLTPDGLAFGAGTFVAYGYNPKVSMSTSGQAFVSATVPQVDEIHCLQYLSGAFRGFGGKQVLALAAEDPPTKVEPFAITSTTGTTWTSEPATFRCRALAESGGVFVASSGNALLHSADGKNYSPVHTTSASVNLLDIGTGGGKFVAVGAGEIAVSADGKAWTATPLPLP
jgi:hypothetical protein